MPDSRLEPNQILHGDSREVLKTFPDASVDSVVTDPPAGISFLSKDWDNPDAYGVEGKDDRIQFIGFLESVMTECFRVLKPGGHMLVWAIPRTSHWTATAIENVGFEIRDGLYHAKDRSLEVQSFLESLSPEQIELLIRAAPTDSWLLHCFGSGFPKSLNVSKAIDKAAGAKREVVGSYRVGGNALTPTSEKGGTYGVNAPNSPAGDLMITKPATPEAEKWDGWGTSLKPAVECWWLCRKPIAESNVTKQVLKTGTGAINIDGTRIAGTPQIPSSVRSVRRFDDRPDQPELAPPPAPNPGGRWPANLILTHSPDCKRVGEMNAPAPVINRFDDGMKPFGEGAGHPYTSTGGGTEVVPIFECVEGCPVLEINRQGSEMGVHPAGSKQPPQPKYEMSEMTPSYSGGFSGPSGSRYGDDGGAARFFLNLEHEVPFYYTAKAAKSEKEDGLEEFGKSARANTHPCLHPDALVMTEKGYRPIKDIRVGDPVLTADGTFHEVELVTQHPYTVESLVEIRVMGTSFTSLVSDNHPYLIWRPTRERNHVVGGEVLWLRADQVTKGDYTMTPIVQGGRPEWEAPRPEDTDFWFIVGLYLAEGCPHSTNSEENHYPSFSLHEDEIALIERIKMYVAPTNIGVYPKKNHDGVLSKGVQVVAFDMELGNLCVRLCGRGAATKSIDPSVWNLPEDSLRAFVEGYFAGDGGMVRTYLQAKSVSQDLASQMRFLGEMLGYKVELQCVPAESGHIGEREFKTTSPVYVLRMSERNRIISHRKPSKPTVLEHEGGVFTLAYVKEVQRVPYVGDVLNLSVEGSHTFQTAVGMSHNTVKSVALMRYLVRMVTPKGGLVLDPFAGSGSTLLAAIQEGDQYIGIEREKEYVNIARKRVGVVGERVARSTAEQDIFELMMVLGENDA